MSTIEINSIQAIYVKSHELLSSAMISTSTGIFIGSEFVPTAERADMILVFDKGEIVEKGEHSDLINSTGIYSKLYESWIGNTREL